VIDWKDEYEVSKQSFRYGVGVPPMTSASLAQTGLSTGLPTLQMPPGSLRGLHLAVGDITSARSVLLERGVKMGEVEEHDQGVKYAAFSDPDGNTWTLQEMPWRSSEF
jgi:catechol 2,3-dioxygenase-like lactoylglutathione lyase family enzyme